ncbi:AMP-binding protein [Caldimonas brevitalea]|uniref:2-aminobenzoate-CoA ligase n=1 Tax=Caldimonas brevitalea TaxID=413882 RepID=A0A0G3BU25_9BURK|nr:AMP-binding protein [Caldimonas brevitalea]AKJ30861.1 2-aminobenzoate-CoA ligase [Caldimonas brevitalea]
MSNTSTKPAEASRRDRFVEANLPEPHLLPSLEAVPAPARQTTNATHELLDAHLGRGTDARLALLSADGWGLHRTSYAALYEKVSRVAHVLVQEMGLVPGERVLLRGPNTLMLAVGWLAVARAGGVAVTTMPLLRAKELRDVVSKARIRLALCDERFSEELELCRAMVRMGDTSLLEHVAHFNGNGADLERRMATRPDTFEAWAGKSTEPALIGFTSGTTGVPKGAIHTHQDLISICEGFARHVLEVNPDDRCCGTPPLGFTFGLGGLLCFPLYHGATGVLAESLTPAGLLQLIQDTEATLCFTVPTFYRQMVPLVQQYRLGSLRHSVSAGESLPATTRLDWHAATGLQMIDGLGSTELLHVFVSCKPQDYRPGAIGRAIPGYQVVALDEALQPLPPGSTGLLAVRGPTGCRYLADSRQSQYVRDGWNLPGDVGWLDQDGYVYYAGRADDLIVSAGYNITGPEVEAVLLQHPAVSECAVVGAPDAARGQIVQAHVVLRYGFEASDVLASELQDFVKATIAPYKYPRSIVFCSSLPRTESGKLQRFKLRLGPGASARAGNA